MGVKTKLHPLGPSGTSPSPTIVFHFQSRKGENTPTPTICSNHKRHLHLGDMERIQTKTKPGRTVCVRPSPPRTDSESCSQAACSKSLPQRIRDLPDRAAKGMNCVSLGLCSHTGRAGAKGWAGAKGAGYRDQDAGSLWPPASRGPGRPAITSAQRHTRRFSWNNY